MDWHRAIEKNREALKGILVMLVAMVGVADDGARGQFFSRASALPADPARTLPRHLHRFVLRLLRPAEAAVRRLIIVAARGLVVELAPPRAAKPRPKKPLRNRRNGFGTGVVIRPGPLPEWALALAPRRSASLSLPLFDPVKHFGVRRRFVKPDAAPRIRSFDDPRIGLFQPPPAPAPPPLSPDDPLDAGRLHRRLEAIGRALDDLPRQATRLARWQARLNAASARDQDQGTHSDIAGAQGKDRTPRLSPMRLGRPPGWRRRPTHAVDEILRELHGLAVWARDGP